ncbi:MAG: endonuclease III [Bacteroidetes bacterium RBG_19FT_COMBO_42_10]|nr:MAG: endonuclease III [Bacteroidetes bacterium RBG_19FT_COMBO_42_10]
MPHEKPVTVTLKERYRRTIEYFTVAMPVAETELEYQDPFELIVAVILSAQCTDIRVNMITPALMQRFPDAQSMAEAERSEIFSYIKSCSYPNSKARYLSEMSKMLVKEFNGIVPSDTLMLQRLPGVGRKTANVVASVVYKKPVLAVDTHVFRVSGRIGLTMNARTPGNAEDQLIRNIPSELVHKAHHWLLLHGRYVCKARNPLCSQCGLTDFCKYYINMNKKL